MQNHLDYSRICRSGSYNLKKKLFRFAGSFLCFLTFVYTLLSWQPWSLWPREKLLTLSGSHGNGIHGDHSKSNQRQSKTFVHNWCRVQKWRVDWKGIISPCIGNTDWGRVMSQSPTDPMTSYIYLWDINPAGQFSRFFIQSQTKDGTSKVIGGDAWRVHISGPAYLAPVVIDHNNGSYEVLFLAMEAGKYQIEIMLDYSLCDGIRDPPSDWFIKGNSQGKNQRYPEVDKSRNYILAKLWGNSVPVDITIPPADKGFPLKDLNALINQTNCQVSCRLLWDGYGRWISNHWVPFVPYAPIYRSPHKKKGTLYFYGDSVMDFFAMSLTQRSLCRMFFQRCVATYNWVYPVINYTFAKRHTDDLDFNKEKLLESVRGVLTSKDMDADSVFIMNFGLHYVESVNFTSYRGLIDGLIEVVQERYWDPSTKRMRLVYEGHNIWKTTTAINKQRATNINLGHKRFLTYQRVLLYNAYATWAMCRAGIPVLDVYPMSDSYPWGTGTHASRIPAPNDVVHYSNLAFKDAEDLLEMMFSP